MEEKQKALGMSPEEARELLLREGLTVRGIHVCARIGDDPGRERLERIAKALDVIIAATRREGALDRELMMALWVIAYHGGTQAEHWQRKGGWRDGEYNRQLEHIAEKVEEYIAGELDFRIHDESEE